MSIHEALKPYLYQKVHEDGGCLYFLHPLTKSSTVCMTEDDESKTTWNLLVFVSGQTPISIPIHSAEQFKQEVRNYAQVPRPKGEEAP